MMTMINKMIKKGLNNKKGFTLIELIIAIGVATVVIGTISVVLIQSNKSFHNVENRTTVVNGVNNILENIRELTFDAKELQISAETSAPVSTEEKVSYISCIDGNLCIDNNVLQNAEGLGIADLEVVFEKTGAEGKILRCTVTAKDDNGNNVITPQSVDLLLNNVNSINGASGNCIKVTDE